MLLCKFKFPTSPPTSSPFDSKSRIGDRYNAKVHPHTPKLTALLDGLKSRVGISPKVIIIKHPDAPTGPSRDEWTTFEEFVKLGNEEKLGRTADGEIEWARLSFDWPLWILFSSGTTGEWFCGLKRSGELDMLMIHLSL